MSLSLSLSLLIGRLLNYRASLDTVSLEVLRHVELGHSSDTDYL